MYTSSASCFRQDLIVTCITNNSTNQYLVKNPTNGSSFEFGEEEYFLCQSINGTSTPSQIVAAFKSRFDLAITEADFHEFFAQIQEYGLLETPNIFSTDNTSFQDPLTTTTDKPNISDSQEFDKATKQKTKNYIWVLPNAPKIFNVLAAISQQLKLLFQFLTWALIPSLIIAIFTLTNNQELFWSDIRYIMTGGVPFLLHFLLNITLIGLFAKTAQCVVFTACGGEVEKFGLTLTLGFHPRFYVDRTEMFQLTRQKQLWTFATPLLFRLGIMAAGVLTWHFTRGTQTALGTGAILLAHSAFFEFLFDSSPLLPTDGYYFLVTALNLPPNYIKRVYKMWDIILSGRPLPKSLATKEKLVLILVGFLSIVFCYGFCILIIYLWTDGLSETFSRVFGRGTDVLFLGILTAVALYSPVKNLFKKWQFNKKFDSISTEQPVNIRSRKFKLKHWKKTLGFFLLAIILLLPYPYRPGGNIELLPPTQQTIQAQVNGKITKVFFTGGDGQWIKQNHVIATMESVDIENEVQVLKESIKKQQADLESQQANLNKLIAIPRPEDVELAKQKIEIAKQQVAVATQQIEVAKGQVITATNKSEFSAREAERFKSLYRQGAYSLQQYENSEKQNELDRNEIVEKQQTVIEFQQNLEVKKQNIIEAQANLAVVLSGSHPQDIAAARKHVEVAEAELQRLRQELKYNESQVKRTTLLMPIDGHLITPYLPQKIGTYLKQGEAFAVAEDDRHISGEIQVPEYSTGDFILGRKVEIKLLSYSDKPIIGKVISIQPNAVSESTSNPERERVINVIVDIPNTEKKFKAGMTGYAKIEGKNLPVVVAFTRPIIRFIQVEVWSWLP
ncbi:MAG: HlyD family secretion protein [Chroococcus sp. CMT-3BRIN-NPC107]|jgi:multidrug resistance efflux pump|nr:HlyD family secretion protein [Chroococcus sp. CMT-3BRIN-NPC107]